MRVSIIIPTYNETDVIGECLESLSEQSYQDLEITVVDDGSSDDTRAVVSNSQFTIHNLQTLRQDHKGAGAARNLGAKKTKGEILVFVDADMTFDKNFIMNLVKPIEAGEAVGTFSKEEYLSNKENIWARCWNVNRGLPPDKMHPRNYPDTQKVFRAILKAEFEKAGGFDEKAGYIDDWSLSEKSGKEATAAPGAIFYHRNPDTLGEVFSQSKWMAKRKYKLGPVGVLIGLVRVSFPISVIVGLFKSLTFYPFGFAQDNPESYRMGYLLPFTLFKIVSDFGVFVGILEHLLTGKVSK